MASYLTAADALTRLEKYGISGATVTDGDVEAASADLDALGPFIGQRNGGSTQALAFPRTLALPGETAGATPDRVLDWVALRAYQLTQPDEAPVTEEGILRDRVKYSRARRSCIERLMRSLLKGYRAGSARIVPGGEAPYGPEPGGKDSYYRRPPGVWVREYS
jgi:hypothetical protein